jgi:putative addiction module component (TIGR02574 family)
MNYSHTRALSFGKKEPKTAGEPHSGQFERLTGEELGTRIAGLLVMRKEGGTSNYSDSGNTKQVREIIGKTTRLLCYSAGNPFPPIQKPATMAFASRYKQGEQVMSPTLIAFGIDKLSVAERLLLMEEIWDSIPAQGEEIPLTEVQKLDLQRRVAAYEANPKAGSSWEEVKARLQGKP